jgi:hypothetical protein
MMSLPILEVWPASAIEGLSGLRIDDEPPTRRLSGVVPGPSGSHSVSFVHDPNLGHPSGEPGREGGVQTLIETNVGAFFTGVRPLASAPYPSTPFRALPADHSHRLRPIDSPISPIQTGASES